MARPRKSAVTQAHKPQESDLVPAPYNHFYQGSKPEEESLGTTLLSGSEALVERWLSPAPLNPPVSYATTPEGAPAAYCEDFGWLLDIMETIQTRLNEDPRRVELLTRLREDCGSGEILPLLFRSLHPDQNAYRALDAEGKPLLSDREVEILREAASDLPHEKIAERLGISWRTVNTHFKNIYKKLGVQRPMQAVARAIAMGYLSMDTLQQVGAAADCWQYDFGHLHHLLAPPNALDIFPTDAQAKSLADFALLLFATLSIASKTIHHSQHYCQPGIVMELDADGKLLRSFQTETLRTPGGIAIAPPQAAQQGFSSGHLFVMHALPREEGCNRMAITEFTPDGEFVRTFCGSKNMGTRLVGYGWLGFAADGRLLVTTGGPNDAMLAFRNGGATVERFVEGAFLAGCVTASGRIYASQFSTIGSLIKVFDNDGRLLQTFGGTPARTVYSGLAANSCGHLIATREDDRLTYVEEYEAHGELRRELVRIGGCNGSRLALDDQDNLYVMRPEPAQIEIFSPEGRRIRQIEVPEIMTPLGLALSADGRMWVCG